MRRYRLAVCKGPDCKRNGADAVYAAARAALAEAGLETRCELYRGGCYGFCHLGANVVLREDDGRRDPFAREDYRLMGWPGETYYWDMNPQKMARVVKEHVGRERVVTELVGDTTLDADTRRR